MSKISLLFLLALPFCVTDGMVQSRNKQAIYAQGKGTPPAILSASERERNKITTRQRHEIIHQMVRDSAIEQDCANQDGKPDKVIQISPVDLNRDGKPEFLVEGNSGCACAMQRCHNWIYQKTDEGYELILDAGPIEWILRRKTSTNGYIDLEVVSVSGPDGAGSTIYKFDGTDYKEQARRK